MNDLVEELRARRPSPAGYWEVMERAADEIERLRSRLGDLINDIERDIASGDTRINHVSIKTMNRLSYLKHWLAHGVDEQNVRKNNG